MPTTTETTYRPHDWFDTKAMEPLFGIQARRPGGKWQHVARDGKPLLFATANERDTEIRRLQEPQP